MTPLTIRHKTFNRDFYHANRNRHLRHLHYDDLQTSYAVGVSGAANSVNAGKIQIHSSKAQIIGRPKRLYFHRRVMPLRRSPIGPLTEQRHSGYKLSSLAQAPRVQVVSCAEYNVLFSVQQIRDDAA